MKIGFFDSGLGGLIILKAVRDKLPHYNYIYLGDTLHLPYGGRSTDAIYEYSRRAIDYLFHQNCNLIITACNTVSAAALRTLQQKYLPNTYPDRRILGVIVPTLEEASRQGNQRIGLLATDYTIQSNIYHSELEKINPNIRLYSQSAPLLVPLIEHDGLEWIDPILQKYLQPLILEQIQSLILGCTHYPYLKNHIKKQLNDKVSLISQDEIIPEKLADYLQRHPEINSKLAQDRTIEFYATDITEHYKRSARSIYGETLLLTKITI